MKLSRKIGLIGLIGSMSLSSMSHAQRLEKTFIVEDDRQKYTIIESKDMLNDKDIKLYITIDDVTYIEKVTDVEIAEHDNHFNYIWLCEDNHVLTLQRAKYGSKKFMGLNYVHPKWTIRKSKETTFNYIIKL